MTPRVTLGRIGAVLALTVLSYPFIGLDVAIWCLLAYAMLACATKPLTRLKAWIEACSA